MENALVLRLTSTEEYINTCLNPCFNGKCTRTGSFLMYLFSLLVLILVLMENALVPFNFDEDDCDILVLILVLMENALVLLVLLVFE